MKKIRTKAYWLLLLTLLYTAFAVLSVGETQARYVNTATWDLVVDISEDQVSSNLLRNVNDLPVTVLLGEMADETYQVPIVLQSGVDAEGELSWSASPDNYEDYITVQLRTIDNLIAQQEVISLYAEEPYTMYMDLCPSANAFSIVRKAVTITITVNWGNTLEGVFQVVLPEVTADMLKPSVEGDVDIDIDFTPGTETDPTDPIEDITGGGNGGTLSASGDEDIDFGGSSTDETENTEPTEGDIDFGGSSEDEVPTEPSDPAETQPTEPESTEPEATEPEETQPEATEPEATEPEATEPEPTEPEATEPEATEPEATEPEEPDPTVPVVELGDIDMQTVECFEITGQLPLQIVVPQGAVSMELGMGVNNRVVDRSGKITGVTLNPFPAYLCYSLDNGESYYMLYQAGMIELDSTGRTSVSVLLDFSKIGMQATELNLAVVGRNGDSLVAAASREIQVEAAQQVALSSSFLTMGSKLTIEIPKAWQIYDLDYTVEMLAADEETGELIYVPVDLKDGPLTITSNKSTGALILQMGEKLPQAGSYRISMNWTSEGTCVKQAQETFFINYLAFLDAVETGGAEQ